MSKEIWKPIKGFEDYYLISNYGRLKSLRFNKIMKPSVQKHGYILASLTINSVVYYRYIHRLVADNFLNKIEGKEVVNHKDGKKNNNYFENLEYCTDSENNRHAGINNLKPFGTKHKNSKFTKKDLEKIKNLLQKSNLTHKFIANKFSVARSTISRISNGTTYSKEYLNA
jgi:predicted XRE-type DNA-binding protein